MAAYRPNVCIVVRKKGSDLFLLCHRKGFPSERGWQFPQGGLHPGADLESEMRRELAEETGIKDVAVVGIAKGPYVYDFPKGASHKHPEYAGQTQQWVLVDFAGNDNDVNVMQEPPEFDSWRWASASEALDKIVDFKKEAYLHAMADLNLFQEPQK